MVKNIYEILDEFSLATTKEQRVNVLQKYKDHPALVKVLKLTFDPTIQFYYNSFPKEYRSPNVNAISDYRFVGLENEVRRLYLFIKGEHIADKMTEEKRNILFLEILESLEPREAQVLINIMKKDLNVKHLTKNLVLDVFPNIF